MFNLRKSIIAGVVVFILSLLIGLFSGASFLMMLLRAFIFGALFFGLANFITLMVNRFLPELLDAGGPAPEISLPGSKIDLSEDSPAVPGNLYARPDESENNLDSISDIGNAEAPTGQVLAPAGLDQNTQNDYNNVGQGTAGEAGGFDVLPDLESLAGAFIPGSGDKPEVVQEYQTSDAPKNPTPGSSRKAQKMDGDFNPKELAAGIRTILNKQEG